MKANGKPKPAFDLKVFLTKANRGRTMADHDGNGVIFSQGDPADAVFYILKAKSSSPSFQERERKRL
jgi:CRP/FNR family cyclic AMP-dependent transcriptional regulator